MYTSMSSWMFVSVDEQSIFLTRNLVNLVCVQVDPLYNSPKKKFKLNVYLRRLLPALKSLMDTSSSATIEVFGLDVTVVFCVIP